jgi:RNA polymerase sigma-70 factor (ECF subfamily)
MASSLRAEQILQPPSAVSREEEQLIAALRRGDEAAFVTVVDQYHATMLRLARVYVADQAVAEEVVQEAWLGVLHGLSRFEGRCALKTWIFRILTNVARTRSQREYRCIAFSRMEGADDGSAEPAVDPDRFAQDGHWAMAPQNWEEIPEERILAAETRAHIQAAVETLPARQRAVITLRDIEGWSADEVCNLLEITAIHQRVLLHRARSTVRQALDHYLTEEQRWSA